MYRSGKLDPRGEEDDSWVGRQARLGYTMVFKCPHILDAMSDEQIKKSVSLVFQGCLRVFQGSF